MSTASSLVIARTAAVLAALALLVGGIATPASAEPRDEHCVILLTEEADTSVCADTREGADAAFAERTGLIRAESVDEVGPLVTYTLATLYTDAGYGGSTYTFVRATPCDGGTLSSVASLGSLNDAVSSFQTSSGCQVRLYSDASYGGSTYGYTTSQSSLPTFNDVASSARVR